MDFSGKHIAITGASSGIGLETARLLAQRGAKVTLIARRADKLEDATRNIGDNASFAAADVGNREQLEKALELAASENGAITGLFANAGLTGGFTPLLEYPADLWEDTLRVNLTSVSGRCRRCCPPWWKPKAAASSSPAPWRRSAAWR